MILQGWKFQGDITHRNFQTDSGTQEMARCIASKPHVIQKISQFVHQSHKLINPN